MNIPPLDVGYVRKMLSPFPGLVVTEVAHRDEVRVDGRLDGGAFHDCRISIAPREQQ